ncbi:MAG: PEP-CTERM sorting domain-containing protein [Thermoguttaceae bacterium]
MKIRTILAAVAVSVSSSVGEAGIISLSGYGDSDLSCIGSASALPSSSATLSLSGAQSGMHDQVSGTIGTSSAADPYITYTNSITNNTNYAWTGYDVTYTLYSDALLTSGSLALASPPVTTPAGWNGAIAAPLAYVGTVTYFPGTPYEYQGQIDYTGGAPIPPNSNLDFTYSLTNFAGATNYTYSQQMQPVVTAVPEPATLALLGAAALSLLACARRRQRSSIVAA